MLNPPGLSDEPMPRRAFWQGTQKENRASSGCPRWTP